MRRPHSLLLHALLCLALVANGVGAAMASVHGGCGHDHARSAVAEPPPPAEPPYHEGMPAEAPAPMHDSAAADPTDHAAATHDDGCCDSTCDCTCINHCQAALPPATLRLQASTGIAYAPAHAYSHAAPALPHPIRPPIG
jgi:hypothetical protein